ncbi:hypothetical protein C8F01DRAFT_1108716 [Mycena amicta]|nr:hypothetical protein C8F01DRAFT_1108716 [Mycena amicta]
MPCLARTILLALHATAFLALTGLAPATTTALASPLPDSTSLSSLLAARVVNKHKDAQLVSPASAVSPNVTASSPQSNDVEQRIRAYAVTAKKHRSQLQKLANEAKTQPHARRADNLVFQQQCISRQVKGAGNQCYDPNSGLQVALHDILDCITTLTATIPILGPIVYDVKCIVDAILNLVTDTVDCLLGPIVDLLKQLGLGGILDSVCKLGQALLVPLLGESLGGLLCL